jgi:three-Cys-motif partner protein
MAAAGGLPPIPSEHVCSVVVWTRFVGSHDPRLSATQPTVVALRRPEDLGPPQEDGLPARTVGEHQAQKGYYLTRFTDSAARSTKDGGFRGVRTYIEPFAASGVCIGRESRALSWGSALVALQIDNPFDLYVLNDIDPEATAALSTRAERLGVPGAAFFELDLASREDYRRAHEIRELATLGPKIVITTGDANDLPIFVKALQPRKAWRYSLALVDPTSAMFWWESLGMLAYGERAMDLISLFPDSIDLARGMSYYLNNPVAGAKIDAYFGHPKWQEIVRANPTHCEHALLRLYEEQIAGLLGMNIGRPRGVGPTRRQLLYHLIFASKNQFGVELWDKVNRRDWDGQDELYLGPGF